MLPIVPHMASECLNEMSSGESFNWPTIDRRFILTKKCNIVIQVNAKKRAIIEVDNGQSKESLLEKINEMKDLQKFLKNKKIIKTIFVKDRLINLIVK